VKRNYAKNRSSLPDTRAAHKLPDSPKLDNKFVTTGSALKESADSAAITGIVDTITFQKHY